MTNDEQQVYFVKTKLDAAAYALTRGAISSARNAVTQANGDAAMIQDAVLRAQKLGEVSAYAQKITDLDNSGKASQLAEAAASSDALVVAGVLEANAPDSDTQRAAIQDKADTEAAREAIRRGLNPDVAYNVGLGAAEGLKGVQDLANFSLPFVYGAVALVALVGGLYLYARFGK